MPHSPLYATLRRTIYPKIASYRGVPWVHPNHQPKRHLDRVSRFSTMRARYQRTDRPTLCRKNDDLTKSRPSTLYLTERHGLISNGVYRTAEGLFCETPTFLTHDDPCLAPPCGGPACFIPSLNRAAAAAAAAVPLHVVTTSST